MTVSRKLLPIMKDSQGQGKTQNTGAPCTHMPISSWMNGTGPSHWSDPSKALVLAFQDFLNIRDERVEEMSKAEEKQAVSSQGR